MRSASLQKTLLVFTIFSVFALSWLLSRATHPDLCFSSDFISKIVLIHSDQQTEVARSCAMESFLSFSVVKPYSVKLQTYIDQVESLNALSLISSESESKVLFIDELKGEKTQSLRNSLIFGAHSKKDFLLSVASSYFIFEQNVDQEILSSWIIKLSRLGSSTKGLLTKNEFISDFLYQYYLGLNLKSQKMMLKEVLKYGQKKNTFSFFDFNFTKISEVKKELKKSIFKLSGHINELAFSKTLLNWRFFSEKKSHLVVDLTEISGFQWKPKKSFAVDKSVYFVGEKSTLAVQDRLNIKSLLYPKFSKRKVYFVCAFPTIKKILNDYKSANFVTYVKSCDVSAIKSESWKTLARGRVEAFLRTEKTLKYFDFHLDSLHMGVEKSQLTKLDLLELKESMGWQEVNWDSKSLAYLPKAVIDGVLSYR